MDAPYRAAFNRAYSKALFERYLHRLESSLGHFPFQVAETPLFVNAELRERLTRASIEVLAQASEPKLLETLKRSIPARYDAPGMDPLPNCVQVDFALTPGEGDRLEGKIVELQAFPSGYAMMSMMAEAWNEELRVLPGLEGDWTCFLDLSAEKGLELMRKTICADEDPEHVALVDFEPESQKTSPDFIATRRLFGVEMADAKKLIKEGNRLFREVEGKRIPVRRIYNRMVFDELEAKKFQLPFDFRDPLDVTWCSHPNWYWTWSKVTLPYLNHPAVPRTRFISDVRDVPEDLTGFVLKPLFSFAGTGVVVDVSPEDLAKIPADQRRQWILQDKVVYAPAFHAPDGSPVKAEIRVMLLRPPEAKDFTPIIFLVRLSRGKMLGVDHNKGMDWVGGTVAIWQR